MPSTQTIPTLADLRQAFRDGVIGQRERRADVHDGSAYDLLGGMAAMLFSRQAQRDRDLFRAVYLDSAEAEDLTSRAQTLFGITRFVDAYGTGTATIVRPTAAAGAGTIPTGTRLFVWSPAGTTDSRICATTADVVVQPSALSVQVPIRATTTGAGTAVTLTSGLLARIDDPLWDSTWTVQALQTSDGTAFEKAEAYRARVRAQPFLSRAGYAPAIIAACQAAGAVNVVPYPSNWAGDTNDIGYSVVYVGDASYTASTSLVSACILALESARVLGPDMAVLPMTSQAVSVSLTVSLYDDPGVFNTTDLTLGVQAAVGAYVDGRKNAFSYQVDAIAGAVRLASTAIQGVTLNAPTSSVGIMQTIGGVQNFPAVLTRYTVVPGNVAVAFVGPQ